MPSLRTHEGWGTHSVVIHAGNAGPAPWKMSVIGIFQQLRGRLARNTMSAFPIVRAVLFGALKLIVFAVGVYAICSAAVRIQRASSPTTNDVCSRVQLGMTVNQIDDATRAFEGWQLLRYDGVMVISAGPNREGSVCRVAIDPFSHQAVSKVMGPLQSGDRPTL